MNKAHHYLPLNFLNLLAHQSLTWANLRNGELKVVSPFSLFNGGSLSVSALNDDKNYYDYHDLFQDKIESIVCIRPAGLDGCFELQNFLKGKSRFFYLPDSVPRL